MSEPAVSILLPADADVAVTLRCLEALARLPDAPAFEVVIVVGADDHPTRGLVGGLEGDVRVVIDETGAESAGDAFDRAAAVATAGTLVLLSAHAVPADGWLGALLAPLAAPGDVAVLPRSLTTGGIDLPEASWLALAVRAEPYLGVGGFAATRRLGRAEKGTLLDALRADGGTVAAAGAAVLLAP